jgi:hypothetical protein
MSVERKRLWAVFYLRDENVGTSYDPLELAKAAGARECKLGSEAHPSVSCVWDSLRCEVLLIKGIVLRIMVISFWQSDFLRMITDDEGLGSSENLLTAEFRNACEALRPIVAFLAVHLDQATYEYVIDRELWVLNKEANRFVSEGLGLLYFSPDVDELATPSKLQQDREYVTIANGRLMFAGSGKSRWFGGRG